MTVNTTADDNVANGSCSLREAMQSQFNGAAHQGCTGASAAGPNTIKFSANGTYTVPAELAEVIAARSLTVSGAGKTIDIAATVTAYPKPSPAPRRRSSHRRRASAIVGRMTTLFISDLHLDDERPFITELFLQFLRGEAREAQALYILGDLFESWIGDDDDAPLAQQVQDALAELSRSGVATYFMAGNRDFLVGPRFAQRSGLTVLEDPTCIDLAGVPTLLMHGDTLCTDDVAYQAFRAQVRDPAWQQAFLAQPLEQRRAFAAQARAQSRLHTGTAMAQIMDVTDAAVHDALRTQVAQRLIHGHTHRPARHRVDLGDRVAERIVLGDWYEQGSVLRVDGSAIELARFR